MNQRYWKHVHIYIPTKLTAAQVLHYIDAEVRITASEAGDFVEQIGVGTPTDHDTEWRKWSVSYLPGPPQAFPTTASAI